MIKIEKQSDEMTDIERLRRRVEETIGKSIKTPSHFDTLAHAIYNRTGVLLSTTTLKRLWGYIDESVSPRRSTLDVLARFCGWNGYDEFISGENPAIESGNIGVAFIRADSDVVRGELLKLLWAPDRVCVIEYDGDQKWHVVSSENTKLQPGDSFNCALIVEGEPLFLDNLRQGNRLPGVYVCGRRNGVKFIRIFEEHG